MGELVNVTAADHLATIRLDRPPMNAVNTRMQVELSEAAAYVGRVPQFRAAVVYGGPKVFAGGADVKEMADKAHLDMQAFTQRLQAAFTAVAEIPKPVVAAITGYALGGGLELALCADFRVCGESAKLGQPEILLGIIPGAGGTQRLPRLIGPARAKNLIFTGRMVDAAEALRIGLVDEVVPDAEVYTAATRLAARFATGPAQALRAAKHAIDAGLEVGLDTGLEIERLHFSALFATEDQKIGMHSFIDDGPGKARFLGH
jgi:enoyl-CoA hydratase/carnithine racemase